MSSKRARGTKTALASNDNSLRSETERLIQKEWYKDAVKQAKLCYKEASTPDHHRLLERAYFLRARQLTQLGMHASAAEVAHHLLEFGVTASDWADEFVQLLMNLGLGKDALAIQSRVGSPEMKDRLVVMAADNAVIHADRAQAVSPEVASHAGLIRRALEQLQNNDEAGAFLVLRDLPRGSLLSEWKLFVRGLAAHYRHDAAEMKANWDRLDPKRKASVIAGRLLKLMQTDASGAISSNTEAAEKLAFGEPVLARLREMRGLAAQQDWEKIIRLLGSLRHSLRQIDPKLAMRLTGSLLGPLIKEAEDLDLHDAERLIGDFTRLAEPLAIDPKWNRLWALLWEGPQGAAEQSLDYWSRYLDDLNNVVVLGPAERALAQALVWNHMAGLLRDEAADLSEPDGPFGLPRFAERSSRSESPELKRVKQQLIDCLEQSLRLAPDHLPTYEHLVEVYRSWDDKPKLEAAARRLLEKFPDHLETLQRLAKHFIEQNDPTSSLPFVQRARALKPLDESLRELEWTIRIGMARNHALAQRWDAGRAEFDLAEQLLPDCRTRYTYLARRLIFELKASRPELSDRYLQQARASISAPGPLWLSILIESIRYATTAATQKGYAQLWDQELKKKFMSETAGEMASILDGYLRAGIEYTGRDGHVKKVVAYIRRGLRAKYRRIDIERISDFLSSAQEQTGLIEKIVKAGVKQHPDSILLNMQAGLLELGKGPFSGGIQRALAHLETARKLAESSTDPKSTAMLPRIRSALTLIKEMTSGRLPFGPFGGGPMGFPFPGSIDDFDIFGLGDDDDDDEVFDDDDFDGDAPSGSPLPQPRAPGKSKPKKRRKKR